ncbi:hypothetical protein [Mycobacterium sp. TY815]|uniref:hypothetical protein n=1 Tax=Mycobacterium sp. TY815 TaxID=3050581 RepID=UPI0027407B28|nr:hypothetical protein [Mycobacterium sp. TY815]MDP7704292.1 hypothetical protein [Mycobacterium sp. TY815]
MTLIQTFFSADYVIQVSDRRLTKADGSVFDDEYTKLICWNQTFTAGFTGLARIDIGQKKSTSEWIAEVLCDYPAFGYGVDALRREAENAIRKLPNHWDKRLAVVIAGFDSNGKLLCAEVANFDATTGFTSDQNSFALKGFTLVTGRKTGSHTAGAPLNEIQNKLLRRYLPRIVNQTNGINRAIKIMVENQRRVAKLHKTVGLDAQCVFIPRQQHQTGMVLSNLDGTDISTTGSSFGFFDAGGFQYEQFGPLFAHGGLVVDQFTGTADPANPDNQAVSVRFVKVPPSWSQSNSS